jgi:uncharacterized protein
MIDPNVRALTELSVAFLDSLTRHREGILNVVSVAAFTPGLGMAVYYASKPMCFRSAKLCTKTLVSRRQGHRALSGAGAIPGARRAFRDRMPNVLMLTAARLARIGYDGFMGGRRVVVAGMGNRIVVLLLQFMPHALLLPLLDWGMRRSARPIIAAMLDLEFADNRDTNGGRGVFQFFRPCHSRS